MAERFRIPDGAGEVERIPVELVEERILRGANLAYWVRDLPEPAIVADSAGTISALELTRIATVELGLNDAMVQELLLEARADVRGEILAILDNTLTVSRFLGSTRAVSVNLLPQILGMPLETIFTRVGGITQFTNTFTTNDASGTDQLLTLIRRLGLIENVVAYRLNRLPSDQLAEIPFEVQQARRIAEEVRRVEAERVGEAERVAGEAQTVAEAARDSAVTERNDSVTARGEAVTERDAVMTVRNREVEARVQNASDAATRAEDAATQAETASGEAERARLLVTDAVRNASNVTRAASTAMNAAADVTRTAADEARTAATAARAAANEAATMAAARRQNRRPNAILRRGGSALIQGLASRYGLALLLTLLGAGSEKAYEKGYFDFGDVKPQVTSGVVGVPPPVPPGIAPPVVSAVSAVTQASAEEKMKAFKEFSDIIVTNQDTRTLEELVSELETKLKIVRKSGDKTLLDEFKESDEGKAVEEELKTWPANSRWDRVRYKWGSVFVRWMGKNRS